MTSFNIMVPKDFAFVGLVASLSPLLLVWQTQNVVKARKAAQIKYPQLYATPEQAETSKEAQAFNCAQRAHANTLEHYTVFLFTLLYSGLKYPRVSAALGTLYLSSRLPYTIGYSSGEPRKRTRGSYGFHTLFGMVGLSIYTAVQFVVESL